jgi:hypothetical protein
MASDCGRAIGLLTGVNLFFLRIVSSDARDRCSEFTEKASLASTACLIDLIQLKDQCCFTTYEFRERSGERPYGRS